MEANQRPEDVARRAQEQAPVEEAGGGESEGFEQSEQQLIDRAEGEKGHGHPLGDRFTPEEAHPEANPVHGEADKVGQQDSADRGPQD